MNEELNMEDSKNQKFCLKWNNFHNNFLSQFEALKEDEDFVDVTLYSYGQCIKAHKVVLSACSPYLKNIFKENPCKHPIIILDNLSFNNLEAVIQFIYTGQVYIEQDELSSFLKAAETLQIRGLSESSNNNNLKTDLPQVHVSDGTFINRKREADFDNENKKIKSKKIIRRTSDNSGIEGNECFDDPKDTDKDCCININNKSEANNESTSLNFISGEQTFENDGKILNSSSQEEDCASGELKKPHWLDPRSCPVCNRVYSNLSNLRQHIKLIHNPTVVTCKLCYKTFKTDLYLRRHLIGFHELNISGSGGNPLMVESSQQSQYPEWNPNIKLEPDGFQEMFTPNEMYQIPH